MRFYLGMNLEGGVPSRTKGKSLLTDQQIELDGKNQDHERDQMIKDTVAYLTVATIIALPVLLLLVFLYVIYGYVKHDQFDKIEKICFAIGGVILGYCVRYLQGRKILPEDK